MDAIDTVVKKFRALGLKVTPQRVSILEIMQGNTSHPSAEEVYRKVQLRHPSISFTTVYKTLQTLRDMGEVTEINVNPERSHFDPQVDGHSHAFCVKCRSLLDVAVFPAGETTGNPAIPGFTVREVQTHFVGVCAPCRGERKGR
jgi:Fur family peroxide stress response transcriptional regulator